jgi:hypothetical protein
VIEVNRKILVISVALMFAAMLATPVFAIGPPPQNAVNNPNADVSIGWTQLFLPSGLFIEWVPSFMGNIFFQHKSASDFYIGNAIEMTIDSPDDMGLFFAAENKWILLSQDSYASFLLFAGTDTSYAELYPDGLYIRFVFVGK